MVHFFAGLWRLVSQVEGVARLGNDGWDGLISLMTWCANRGGKLKAARVNELKKKSVGGGFREDDPALQSYRSVHHLLHSDELGTKIPNELAACLGLLTRAGQLRNYQQLSMASLDLFPILIEKRLHAINDNQTAEEDGPAFWSICWRRSIEDIASAAEFSPDSSIRQHALSMLTDLFLDKRGSLVPVDHLCGALTEVCVPLAGKCILKLQAGERLVAAADEVMIEFELCIGILFKPMRQHLQALSAGSGALALVWRSMLLVLEELLAERAGDSAKPVLPASLESTMHNLVNEHLRNAVIVLCSSGFLNSESDAEPDEITTSTWDSIKRMGIQESVLQEWKKSSLHCE
jgi:hypothetical protein